MSGQASSSLERIRSIGVMPVVEVPDRFDAVALADALAEAGLPCIEITLRTTAGLEAIRTIRRDRPDIVVVAGTVLTVAQVDAAVDAGAALLVAPGFGPAVVERALALGVAMLPGASTPTEVEMGLAHGLETFKFFPAEAAGGVAWLNALRGPYRQVRFVPTGGIDATNLERYLRLPNVIACGGSWMVTADLLAGPKLDEIERLGAEAASIVRRVRASTTTT